MDIISSFRRRFVCLIKNRKCQGDRMVVLSMVSALWAPFVCPVSSLTSTHYDFKVSLQFRADSLVLYNCSQCSGAMLVTRVNLATVFPLHGFPKAGE